MGDVITFARDTLINFVSKLGTGRDKASASFYSAPVLTDDQLVNAYRVDWLAKKLVSIPALDSCRAWRDWQAGQDEIELIEAEERRLNLKAKVLEARTKARLFGGAAIFIGTGDVDNAKPLDPEALKKGGVKYLVVMTRRQLTVNDIENDPLSEFYGKPNAYQINGSLDIHPSRLVVFQGDPMPDDDLAPPLSRGWGDSVLISTLDAIKNATATAGNIASLIFEARVDVIRIPNLMTSLHRDPDYTSLMLDRFQLAATAKGINQTLLLDSEETYEQKSASFATLPDVLNSFLQIVSGAADIPITRLLGQSPAGMSATGTHDMKNYHDRISAAQQLEMTPAMARLDECLIRSALGSRPPEIYYTWSPLEQMSEIDKATIFKTKADAARTIAGGNGQLPLINLDALSEAFANELIEDGSLAGLDAAIEANPALPSDEEEEEAPDDPEERGAPIGDATFRRRAKKTKARRRYR